MKNRGVGRCYSPYEADVTSEAMEGNLAFEPEGPDVLCCTPRIVARRHVCGWGTCRSLQIFLASSLLISLWRGMLDVFLAARLT
jgi:hypothetical protein